MDKLVASADAAVADIPDGATIMVSGFGLCGNPETLIAALHRKASASCSRRSRSGRSSRRTSARTRSSSAST
jgi:acyl CoA:acetate/3-ketoacid CoA transferase